MAVATVKSDETIQQDVYRELKWDSRVDPTEIGVEVSKGIVTISGTVGNYAKKLAAREAAHRVAGVLDVADEVQVKFAGSLGRTDAQIAEAVRCALEWDVFVPDKRIRSTVSNGYVTLEGEVDNLRQKTDAERAVQGLEGVRGVNNWLRVSAVKVDPNRIRKTIEEALERRAEREAEKIRVTVEDGKVILDGRIRNWSEKKAILGLVSHAPGVREVGDRLSIDPWV
jgi:osmotically-inducible protein OsmY